MVKRIDILGIPLDNCTVREAMMQVERYLESNTLSTVEQISMQMLLDSEQDTQLREVMSSLDLSVVGEKDILQAAGITNMQRVQETEENDFSFEFFRRAERNKKSIFVLGETQEKITAVKEEWKSQFPKLIVAGEYALENCVGDLEGVINDLNALTPDVIVSVLPPPVQEHFLWEHKDKMNVSIWYGMGAFGLGKRHGCMKHFWHRLLRFGKLKSSMDKYEGKDGT